MKKDDDDDDDDEEEEKVIITRLLADGINQPHINLLKSILFLFFCFLAQWMGMGWMA